MVKPPQIQAFAAFDNLLFQSQPLHIDNELGRSIMVVMLLHDKADIGTGIVVAVVDLWISVEIALGKHFAVFVGIQGKRHIGIKFEIFVRNNAFLISCRFAEIGCIAFLFAHRFGNFRKSRFRIILTHMACHRIPACQHCQCLIVSIGIQLPPQRRRIVFD